MKKRNKYCCSRFKDSVEEGKIVHSGENDNMMDETEWFMPGWLHIYYCPFCGSYIKGQGYGEPPRRESNV